MRLDQLNEAFKKMAVDVLSEEVDFSKAQELKKALIDKASSMNSMNIKDYEIAFQDVIEEQFPGKAWWQVTNLNIFGDLFENRNIMGTIDRIIDELNEDVVNETVEEEPKESDKEVVVENHVMSYREEKNQEKSKKLDALKKKFQI